MSEIVCRIAPSLGGGFAGTPLQVWGTDEYNPETDKDKPCVFFGLYGLPDFFALWRHRGKKYILFAGSDIRHFSKGYWLDEKGSIRLSPQPLARWIRENCESWVENDIERLELERFGIQSQVCPSFLGDRNEYQCEFEPSDTIKVYASVSGDDFALYKWKEIERMAYKNPQIEFHLYGNTKSWPTELKNVIVHGRISKEKMDEETKKMRGGLRLLDFDGFSEVLAKSVLWGQWPVSTIPYPHMLAPEQIHLLSSKTTPNIEGRNYYLQAINKFPWNQK